MSSRGRSFLHVLSTCCALEDPVMRLFLLIMVRVLLNAPLWTRQAQAALQSSDLPVTNSCLSSVLPP